MKSYFCSSVDILAVMIRALVLLSISDQVTKSNVSVKYVYMSDTDRKLNSQVIYK